MVYHFRELARKDARLKISRRERPKHWLRRKNVLIPLLAFVFIMGMRYDVGTDHLSYLDAYLYGWTRSNLEVGMVLFTRICSFLRMPYPVFFAIIAFAEAAFFFGAFKKESYILPFYVVFLFTTGDVDSWNNILRCSLAAAFWMYSLRYIQEKNPWKYYLMGALAISFHLSSAILVVFYPIFRWKTDYFRRIPLQLALLAVVLVINHVFYSMIGNLESLLGVVSSVTNGAYDFYTSEKLIDTVTSREGTGIAYLWMLLVNVIVCCYSRKMKRYYHSARFEMIYSLFFLGLLAFYVFPGGAILLTRPFRYFFFFKAVMLAYFAYYLMRTKQKVLLLVLVLSFIGLYSLNIITSNANAHQWYQFFFQHPEVPLFPQVI